MSPLDFPLLADENIHPDVVAFLQQEGKDFQTVVGQGLIGQSDLIVLRRAHETGRVILTHDSDFGTLAVMQGEPFTGIIYLRPGHIRAEFTIETLKTVADRSPEVKPPFIVVAERSGQTVRLRVRRL
jgi:predicted nuclease of predicted toxin-antitoxin system